MNNKIIIVFIIVVVFITGCGGKDLYLTEDRALELALKSRKVFFYLMNGGDNPEPEMIKDKEMLMKIMDKKINSKEKVMEMLCEVFTNEEAEEVYKILGFVEKNGVLYRQWADTGSILAWDKAVAKKIETEGNKAVVTFEIPSYPGDEIFTEQIEYVYINNLGWRLNSLVY